MKNKIISQVGELLTRIKVFLQSFFTKIIGIFSIENIRKTWERIASEFNRDLIKKGITNFFTKFYTRIKRVFTREYWEEKFSKPIEKYHHIVERIRLGELGNDIERDLRRQLKYFSNFIFRLETLHYFLALLAGLAITSNVAFQFLMEPDANSAETITQFAENLGVCTWISIILLILYISMSISVPFLTRFSISYIIYLVISYLLLVTQNLNNNKFHFDQYSQNNFFEIEGLQYVLWIMAAGFVLQMLFSFTVGRKRPAKLLKVGDSQAVLILGVLLAIVVIHDSKLLENLSQYLVLSERMDFDGFVHDFSYKIPLTFISVSSLTAMFWVGVEDLKKNEASLPFSIVISVFFAVVFNYALQAGVALPEDFLGRYIFGGATLFQIIVLTLFNITLYLVFNRFWFPTFLILLVGTGIAIANYLKFTYRSEPLLYSDLAMVKDLNTVLGYLDQKSILMIIGLIVILIGVFYTLKNRLLLGKLTNSVLIRATLLFVSLFSSLQILKIFSNQENGRIAEEIPVLTRLNNGHNTMFAGQGASARFQSLMFLWVKQYTTPVMEPVPGYSPQMVEEVVEKYKKRAEEINKDRKHELNDRTVIFVLSESLANPTHVPGVTTTENVLENIDKIKESTTGGLMKSDTYGGGTGNIEIQTLLGLPQYNMSSSMGIFNVQVVPNMRILPSISDSFDNENRIALHLGDTKLYSRGEVYNRLGFDRFIADDPTAEKPRVYEKYGDFPSDWATYENVLENIDTKENQFFSVITYQNHVPWNMPEPGVLRGEGEGFTPEQNETLSHYVRLLKTTDVETKEFLEKLEKIDKDITVVFYGDHLPGLYPNEMFESNPDSRYLTDFFIWSNHNSEKKPIGEVTASDFPALVLSHTNSKVSPYYALLTDIMDKANSGRKELTEEEQIIASDLKIIQYDLVMGKSYLRNFPEFFEF